MDQPPQVAERQASAGARDGVKGQGRTLGARAPLHALVRRRCPELSVTEPVTWQRLEDEATKATFLSQALDPVDEARSPEEWIARVGVPRE